MGSILIETQYIGSASYWNILLNAEKICFDQHEHYVKRSYRNRAHILGANGLLRLSIPLERGKHQHAVMKDVCISYSERWQKLHWQSFTAAYRRSPFFEFYEDYFRKFYTEKIEKLVDYNVGMIETIASILKVKPDISLSEMYYIQDAFDGKDYRSYIMPSQENKLQLPPYPQVFSDRFPFEQDLCILDVLFNLGTRSGEYINSLNVNKQ